MKSSYALGGYPAAPTYSVDYHCSNCGSHRSIKFPKGTRAPDLIECPYCGVKYAAKIIA